MLFRSFRGSRTSFKGIKLGGAKNIRGLIVLLFYLQRSSQCESSLGKFILLLVVSCTTSRVELEK